MNSRLCCVICGERFLRRCRSRGFLHNFRFCGCLIGFFVLFFCFEVLIFLDVCE